MIQTERLYLTPVELADGEQIRRLAGEKAIARDALHIPHPFQKGMAESWIDSFRENDVVLAIRTGLETPLIGLIGLTCEETNEHAELSYWIGRPYWGRGFASEAVRAVISYGFDRLHLNRIFATTLARNAASGRVLKKAGFVVEGQMRQHVKHWGAFEDVILYGMLRADQP